MAVDDPGDARLGLELVDVLGVDAQELLPLLQQPQKTMCACGHHLAIREQLLDLSVRRTLDTSTLRKVKKGTGSSLKKSMSKSKWGSSSPNFSWILSYNPPLDRKSGIPAATEIWTGSLVRLRKHPAHASSGYDENVP